ncbi:thiamine-phosphate synthase [Thermococcus celericrescens]|uniref:Thiamine-phosphate synthase n=1 Tax=Thermococcus celericrescens TaxID=227598 RepID=A0A100XZ63_9EURY|nr:thiamine phosphate synthase [Thermococcus celericrescens]KUH34327.1 thiamine-phosphate synthase [Thermococcus celericrescens]
MGLRKALRLYVITARGDREEVRRVREALEGGATSIQLRAKSVTAREAYLAGREIRKLTREYGALFFVDDRIDLAIALDADGVQLGPGDIPIEVAKNVAPNLIVGASVYSVDEALKAEELGADYLGAGAVFSTPTKPKARVLGLGGLREIVKRVSIPVVAIGGITQENAGEVMKTGVDGVAVISTVMCGPDVKKATQELKNVVGGV